MSPGSRRTVSPAAAAATVLTLVLALVLTLSSPVSARQQPSSGPADPAARAAAGSPGPAVGVAYHARWGDRTNAQRRAVFDRLKRTRATWVRIGFPWALVQPRKPTASDPGWSQWGLDRVDAVVRMARQRGLDVSFTFVGTPSWANGGRGPRYLPTDPGTYARAIRYLAKRYRAGVQSWEIWNEVSGPTYVQGATLADYVKLLCRAYPAVHRGAPGAKVISAGTGGVDWEWVRSFYRAGGKPCFDVLAVHPYNRDRSPYYAPGSEPPLWLRNVRRVRHIMRNHHDASKPVWFTEFGWSTHSDQYGYGVTRQQQAKFLVQMIQMTKKRLPYVKRMAWYMAKDEKTSSVHLSNFGLYTQSLRPKPAARAMRTYLSGVG
jgi:hypothetical protein